MTDTDNSGGKAESYYGDIVFSNKLLVEDNKKESAINEAHWQG